MVTKKIKKLRDEVERSKQGSGRRVRYPESVKRRAVDLIRSGLTAQDLSDQIGIAVSTLFQWSQAQGGGEFRKVTASPRPPADSAESCSVILSNGLRIEGASLALLKNIIEWLQ